MGSVAAAVARGWIHRHWIGREHLSADVDFSRAAWHRLERRLSRRKYSGGRRCGRIGNAIKRGNPEVEQHFNRQTILSLLAGSPEKLLPARTA